MSTGADSRSRTTVCLVVFLFFVLTHVTFCQDDFWHFCRNQWEKEAMTLADYGPFAMKAAREWLKKDGQEWLL